ncbi:MAG: hypothetical protein Aurels2KO_21930 [Aureliella sp.]
MLSFSIVNNAEILVEISFRSWAPSAQASTISSSFHCAHAVAQLDPAFRTGLSGVSALKEIKMYTDGAAVPNPGKGGYGVLLRSGRKSKVLSGGYALTTNNRMELMAVIAGLEWLKGKKRVRVYCDSRYVVDSINKGWAARWRANGWKTKASGTKPVKNPDLWARLLKLTEAHEVEMVWVKGHSGIADNERCDQLAASALEKPELPSDDGYDASLQKNPAATTNR